MNYITMQRESLAVVLPVLILRPFVDGCLFIFRTDIQSLLWILDWKEWAGRFGRWRLRLMGFDFEVQHWPGRKHKAADALFCLATSQTDSFAIDYNTLAYAAADSQAGAK